MKLSGAGIVALGLVILFVILMAGLFSSPDYGQLPASAPTLPVVQGFGGQPSPSVGQGLGGNPSVVGPGGGSALPVALQTPMMAVAPTGQTPGASYVDPNMQLSEAHWQGMEALPLSSELKKKLKLPTRLEGLLIDEVSLQAARSGLMAGDVLVAVDSRPVRTLEDLLRESKRVQTREKVVLTAYRKEEWQTFTLSVAKGDNLGFVQVEAAPMIVAGDIRPHPYRGPCTTCHAIGTAAQMMPDPDLIILPPPPIRADARMPHQDRGPCRVCHPIIN